MLCSSSRHVREYATRRIPTCALEQSVFSSCAKINLNPKQNGSRKMEQANVRNYPLPPVDESQADAAAIDAVLARLDTEARRCEGRWGVERLPLLVPVEMAAKFGSAQAKLNAAIEAADVAMVVERAAIMLRGWQSLDAWASNAVNPDTERDEGVWGYRHGVKPYTIVLDRSKAHREASRSTDPALVVTVAELLTCWEARMDGGQVDAVKAAFPDAAVTAIRRKSAILDDEIPF